MSLSEIYLQIALEKPKGHLRLAAGDEVFDVHFSEADVRKAVGKLVHETGQYKTQADLIAAADRGHDGPTLHSDSL